MGSYRNSALRLSHNVGCPTTAAPWDGVSTAKRENPNARSPVATPETPFDPSTVTVPDADANVAITDRTATDTTAMALLETLPIKGWAPKTGYDRVGQFGTAWLDVDRNGCDTRFPGTFRPVGL